MQGPNSYISNQRNKLKNMGIDFYKLPYHMIDNSIINTIEAQIKKSDDLLKNKKLGERKSWKATNITLLNNLFGKNNEYSNEFQKMGNIFVLSNDGIIDEIELGTYKNYITTGKSILLSVLDLYKNVGEAIIERKGNKNSAKNPQTINVNNNNIINQTQLININIENCLKNELTVKQYEKLNEILQEKNKKTKGAKIIEFLIQLGSETLAKILTNILLGN